MTRIAIVGAGAIGGWVAARLGAAGFDVSLLARGATLAAVATDGLTLQEGARTISVRPAVSDDAGALGPHDLVVFATKAHALAAAAAAAEPLIGPDTLILPMLNGVPWWFLAEGGVGLDNVDPGGRIADALPIGQVIGCVVHASTAVAAPGRIVHKAGNGLILGEPAGGRSERVEALAAVFEKAGFAATASTDIRYDIWYKLWGNMTMNPISALTGADCAAILDDPLVQDFVLRTMAEAAEIGAAIGCPIRESGADRIAVTRKLGAFRTSMLADAEAGRPLELDALIGAPREIARLRGIATPNMDALHGLARLFAETRGLVPA